mgnify:FL=1
MNNTTFSEIITDLVNHLKIDKHDLDNEVTRHSDLLHTALEAHAHAVNLRDAAKNKVEELYAELSLKYRRDADNSGIKMTEDRIKQSVLVDKQYKDVQNDLLLLKLDCDKLAALKDAYTSRGYMLRELAGLWIGGYFSNRSIEGTEHLAETARYNHARHAITDARVSSGKR